MELDQALSIVDPATCREALAPYAGDCDMLHAKAAEACRMVVDAYRAAVAERDAAVRDIQLIAYKGVVCVACGNRDPAQEDPLSGCPKDDTCTYNGEKWSPNFVWRGTGGAV